MTIPDEATRPMRGRGSGGQSARKAIHVPEALWQRQVQQLAKTLGWVDFHHLHSIGTRAGVPDLELLHPGKVLHIRAELKSETGTLSAAQVATLDLLAACNPGMGLFVWRPSDLDDVTAVLHGNRRDVPTEWSWARPGEVDMLAPKDVRRLAELHLEYGLVTR